MASQYRLTAIMDLNDKKTTIDMVGVHPDIIKQSIYRKYPTCVLEDIKIEIVEIEFRKRENVKDISKSWKKELLK